MQWTERDLPTQSEWVWLEFGDKIVTKVVPEISRYGYSTELDPKFVEKLIMSDLYRCVIILENEVPSSKIFAYKWPQIVMKYVHIDKSQL